MPNNLLRQPNFAALVTLVWLLVALALLLQYWTQTAQTLFDTDDAMRLAQLRDWLGGHRWFDLHQARMQPPEGYDTHWSRLIDAGLAGLLYLFGLFTDSASAERLMRAWWPLLWLLPTIAGMAAIAWRVAGREAATVALLLALVGVPAYQQFTPGRIDHHNVQIALTMLAVAATVWSDRWRWGATAAGLLTGLALAIGFEAAPYLACCGIVFALRYVADRDNAGDLVSYSRWLTASSIAGFFVTIGSQHWLRHSCDSIAVNTLAAVICGGLMLTLAGWLRHQDKTTRGFAIAGAGSLAAAVLVLIEPACARGPFGLVDPAIWPIWLGEVREMQPLLAVLQKNPLTGAAIAAFPAAAVVATLVMLQQRAMRRDMGFLAAAAVFLVAVAVTLGAIRAYSYAIWFGMPMVAAMALRLFAVLRLQTLRARLAATLALTPLALSTGAITIAHAAGFDDRDAFDRPASKACVQSASYARLAQLPPGIVATDVSYGPFLLALTPHSVLAGPYHHLSKGIMAAHRSLALPPEQARKILAGQNAAYVMICGPRPPDGLAEPERGGSLWGRLRAGAVPDWLEPAGDNAGQAFAVYRVKR
ncbi:MAG: hypothetical protein QOF91_2367 [Alphaproteobacteria bacterium]|jgi:hypothetical protein|nr:hypothetical protein [Alphaproteobacteria bacterium]